MNQKWMINRNRARDEEKIGSQEPSDIGEASNM